MRRHKIDRDELATVLEDHQEWLESSGELGAKADLNGRDLSRHDLQQARVVSFYPI